MQRSRAVLTLAMVLALAFSPVADGAQALADPEAERFGWKKFWDYTACAGSIALATGTGGAAWVLPILACGRAIQEHWTN